MVLLSIVWEVDGEEKFLIAIMVCMIDGEMACDGGDGDGDSDGDGDNGCGSLTRGGG